MFALLIKEWNGLNGRFSQRVVIYGGPAFYQDFDNSLILEVLLDKVRDEFVNRSVFIQAWNFQDFNDLKSIFEDKQYKFQERLNIILDTNNQGIL